MHKRTALRPKKIYESLCPFLYQTRTLSKCTISRIQRPASTIREETSIELHNSQDNALHFDSADRGLYSEPSKKDPITTRYDFPGSTITSVERAAFRKLISKFGSTSKVTGSGAKHPRDTAFKSLQLITDTTEDSTIQALMRQNIDIDITRIISLFAPETPEMIQEREDSLVTTEHKSAVDSAHQPYPAWRIRETALNALKEISRALDMALEATTNPTRDYVLNPRPAEFAVWQIIESQIFAQMTLLQSLSSTPNAAGTSMSISEYQRATLEDFQMLETSPSCLRSLSPRTPLLPLLTVLYPASILLALRMYLYYLPTSPSALALMPQIKSMGPVSYLLSSNVHFFNALIQLHWTIYSDLASIKIVIDEMKQNHVDPDDGTTALLESIRREQNSDLSSVEMGSEAAGAKIKGTVSPGRSRQWWDVQGASNSVDQLLERLHSGYNRASQ